MGLGALPRAFGSQEKDRLPDGAASKDMITPAAQQAIDQGVAYLVQHQHPDGAFGAGPYHGNVAITSLCAMALMAGGSQPDRGPFGEAVVKALRYVLDREEGQTGFIHNRIGMAQGGPMYGHGFATLFLAEVQGMTQDKELRERLRDTLKRAVELIVKHQNSEGGWRYTPGSRDADISVTICQIMALRAARNAGLFVPKQTVDKCVEYVKRCQDRDGGFRYQAQWGHPSAFARTAAGVVALNCAGVYKGPEVESGLNYLMRFKPNQQFFRRDMHFQHYYYGHYYAVQAMWTAGGNYWAEWYPAIRDELINHPDRKGNLGCWTDLRFSNDYGTAMACIVLQIPNNYRPILQK
jgi:hypothetical protein